LSDNTFSISQFAKLTGQPAPEIKKSLASVPPDATLAEIAATLFNELSIGVKKTGKATSRVSISELSRLCDIDRATVRKRLEGIAAYKGPGNSQLYEIADALPAIITGQSGDIDTAKLRQATADAELREIKGPTAKRGIDRGFRSRR
jgi:hypothetical protein